GILRCRRSSIRPHSPLLARSENIGRACRTFEPSRVARVSWNRIRPRVMEPRARRCDGGILERPCVPGGCPLEGARMSVRILILACAAALAACGASEPAQAPQAPTAARREAPPRYVGLWAVSQAMCESP